jgi:hypothetical protein
MNIGKNNNERMSAGSSLNVSIAVGQVAWLSNREFWLAEQANGLSQRPDHVYPIDRSTIFSCLGPQRPGYCKSIHAIVSFLSSPNYLLCTALLHCRLSKTGKHSDKHSIRLQGILAW